MTIRWDYESLSAGRINTTLSIQCNAVLLSYPGIHLLFSDELKGSALLFYFHACSFHLCYHDNIDVA